MSTLTATVTINAAFLQEIKDDHRELGDSVSDAQSLFGDWTRRRVSPRQAVDLLNRLRDQFAMHFSLEEAFGYFEDAIDVAPHLSRQAEDLRAEHRVLFGQLSALVEQSEQALYRESHGYGFKQLCNGFMHFLDCFHDHESREKDLILQALDEDIGVGD